MCTSPLLVNNPSVYRHPLYTTTKVSVSCGKCQECRSAYMSDWQTRLAFELDSLYKRGGVAIFLTFTFNDDNLPHFDVPIYARSFVDDKMRYAGKEKQSCFNRDLVLKFLNNLKVNVNKLFGKSSYKYFLCSEYGKNTQRPHHHGLFLLESGVDPDQFALLCRKLWHSGFMFPKYDEQHHIWVDNNNAPSSITIRSLVGGCKYVAKYVTKDMSFYELTNVQDYLDTWYKVMSDDEKKSIDNCLPKHWQSKGLGFSLVDKLDKMSDEVKVNKLHTGVTSPLSGKIISIPQYCINKLLYKNVKSSRVSKTTGKNLYDRYLSEFGKAYIKLVYCNRVTKMQEKIVNTLSDTNLPYLMSSCGFPEKAYQIVKDNDIQKLSRLIAHYHYIGVNLTDIQLSEFRELYTVEEFFSDNIASSLYLKSHDTLFKKTSKKPFVAAPCLTSDVLRSGLYQTLCFLHDIFSTVSTYKRKLNLSYYDKVGSIADNIRRQNYVYDKQLC